MEIRVLKYFLEAARESNITRAAERLHVSQPTMSKQIKELEEELGVKLFIRSNYSIRLTEAGMLLRERAEDIVELAEKTEAEFKSLEEVERGDIYVGAAESDSIRYFAKSFKILRNKYPKVRCHIFSGNMEDVSEKLDKGIIDFAIVTNFVDLSKYNYIEMPSSDVWGVVMRKDDKLAQKEYLYVQDLIGIPLICSRQWAEQDFTYWFKDKSNEVNIAATFNLAYNGAVMVKEGIGYAVVYDKIIDTSESSELCFKQIIGVPYAKMYIMWRKKQTFTWASRQLLKEIQESLIYDSI